MNEKWAKKVIWRIVNSVKVSFNEPNFWYNVDSANCDLPDFHRTNCNTTFCKYFFSGINRIWERIHGSPTKVPYSFTREFKVNLYEQRCSKRHNRVSRESSDFTGKLILLSGDQRVVGWYTSRQPQTLGLPLKTNKKFLVRDKSLPFTSQSCKAQRKFWNKLSMTEYCNHDWGCLISCSRSDA